MASGATRDHPAETAAPELRPERRRTHELFGVKNYLRVKSEPTWACGARRPAPPGSRRHCHQKNNIA